MLGGREIWNVAAGTLMPYAEAAHLPYLPRHLPTVLRSLLLWVSLQLLSSGLSNRLFPHSFSRMNGRSRRSWDAHVVSFMHSAVIVPFATYCWLVDTKGDDPLFGYSYFTGQVYAVSLGYFLWDMAFSLLYEGPAFLMHATLAAFAALFTYWPFVQRSGLWFLLWEASTPFLNMHWFLDKLGKTGSRLQLVNAAFLLASYVIVRLTLGVYFTGQLIFSLWNPEDQRVQDIPAMLRFFYSIGAPALTALNYFWFYKMVISVRKRFQASTPPPKAKAT